MKKKYIIGSFIVLILINVLGIYYGVTLRTANSDIAIPIYITEGETFDDLMAEQQKELYIEHPTIFRMMARVRGLDKHLRPGHYHMRPDMRYIELIQKLYRGQQDPVRLTIGKFRTPQQLNEYLDSKLMHNDFNVPLDSFHIILPDTYEFYWTVTPEQFMRRMEKEYGNFKSKMTNEKNPDVAADSSFFISHYSFRDVIILASIVEEETNNGKEKPIIASVYLNRLNRGMPLQADPTVKYAVATTTTSPLSRGDAQRAEGLQLSPFQGGVPEGEGGFKLRRILNKHLSVESPFNTYLHTGLPPAPICLPSKATIQAVLDAPQTNYLYFCASPDMDGTHRFAATLAEHNRNAAAFHAALNRRGIR